MARRSRSKSRDRDGRRRRSRSRSRERDRDSRDRRGHRDRRRRRSPSEDRRSSKHRRTDASPSDHAANAAAPARGPTPPPPVRAPLPTQPAAGAPPPAAPRSPSAGPPPDDAARSLPTIEADIEKRRQRAAAWQAKAKLLAAKTQAGAGAAPAPPPAAPPADVDSEGFKPPPKRGQEDSGENEAFGSVHGGVAAAGAAPQAAAAPLARFKLKPAFGVARAGGVLGGKKLPAGAQPITSYGTSFRIKPLAGFGIARPRTPVVPLAPGEESPPKRRAGDAEPDALAGGEPRSPERREAPGAGAAEEPPGSPAAKSGESGGEVDPLEAFMEAQAPVPKQIRSGEDAGGDGEGGGDVAMEGAGPGGAASGGSGGAGAVAVKSRGGGRAGLAWLESDSEEEEEEESSEEEDDAKWAEKVRAGRTKGDRLGVVDHSKVEYPAFRRNFFIEPPELARMTDEEVAAARQQLDGIRVRGKAVPKPVQHWNQAGLSSRVLDTLRKAGFERPMPIQAQALPVIMSGRDCIGIAKTGSGKTMAYLLPLLRHARDQPALQDGDGPIGLIMAPTRELVQQIGKDARRVGAAAGLSVVQVYGGTGMGAQISALRRGAEVVVCTPGRMIDVLITNNGKVTNLRRVTYLVLDEADRMFDMGFEPQIRRIVQNIRPDRQTVLFSATFPKQVEALARQVLTSPVQIDVGGRSVVNRDIEQLVELRPEEERLMRLLEILGEWYDRGKVLVFVATHEKCDNMYRDLLRLGYPCLSLHGGKEQADRQCTIEDFKGGVSNIMVATSVAARGLDVKDLVLVVNYDPPNHLEDYVHRVGRTGRAGNKGTAITFISEEEEAVAPDLARAMRDAGKPVPEDLLALAKAFQDKRREGKARAHGSGFGGSGFRFDAGEEEAKRRERNKLRRGFGLEEEDKPAGAEDDDGEGDAGVRVALTKRDIERAEERRAQEEADARARAEAEEREREEAERAAAYRAGLEARRAGEEERLREERMKAAAPSGAMAAALAARSAAGAVETGGAMPAAPVTGAPAAAPLSADAGGGGAAAAAAVAAQLAARINTGKAQRDTTQFEAELEINDFPQHARWQATHKNTMAEITDTTGCAVTVKGLYYKPGAHIPEGERKLHLLITGPSVEAVKQAKQILKTVLEEATEKSLRRDAASGSAQGRYTV
ncbi:unnamed protein product [Pedinophyceae sp. YPF-701]|nr:unnamed protein product [Pedinophyceae sp. YPF-701]